VADGLRSVRSVVNDDLSIGSVESYEPFGKPFDGGVFGSPFMFTGEPLDANGLVYLRARYYAPELGVFPSLDPIENLNRYQYVNANPINHLDPSGLCDPTAIPLALACAGAVTSPVEGPVGDVLVCPAAAAKVASCAGVLSALAKGVVTGGLGYGLGRLLSTIGIGGNASPQEIALTDAQWEIQNRCGDIYGLGSSPDSLGIHASCVISVSWERGIPIAALVGEEVSRLYQDVIEVPWSDTGRPIPPIFDPSDILKRFPIIDFANFSKSRIGVNGE
jgi:RHS repeat-associated protein